MSWEVFDPETWAYFKHVEQTLERAASATAIRGGDTVPVTLEDAEMIVAKLQPIIRSRIVNDPTWVDRFNNLDSEYFGLVDLNDEAIDVLDNGYDFTAAIVDASRSLKGVDMAELTYLDGAIPVFLGHHEAAWDETCVYIDDYGNLTARDFTWKRIDPCIQINPEAKALFKSFEREVKQAVAMGVRIIGLPIETLHLGIVPLRRLIEAAQSEGFGLAEEIYEELAEELVNQELWVDEKVQVAREIAELLKPLQRRRLTCRRLGFRACEIAQWEERVNQLQTPSEKRIAEMEDKPPIVISTVVADKLFV